MAPGRQGIDHRRPRPAAPRRRRIAEGIPHAAASAQLHRAAQRADPILPLARTATRHRRWPRSTPTTCEAYLAFRRYILDENGSVVGEQSPAVRRAAAQIVVDLVNYRDLFTADRVRADLRPWGGASASAVAEMRSGRDGNTTPAVADEMLQPMLAAALHLVQVLGPHAVALNKQIREHDRASTRKGQLRRITPARSTTSSTVLAGYTRTRHDRCPDIEDHEITKRLAAGWSADDPLLPVATGILARQAGRRRSSQRWMPRLRGPLTDAVAAVGVEKVFARDAEHAPTADGATRPWTPAAAPLAGRRRGRDRPNSGDHRARGIIRDAQQRADGTACRLPPPDRGTLPGLSVTASPARSSKASPSAAPTTNGSSSNPPSARSNSPSNSTTTRAKESLVLPLLLPGPLHLVPQLGQLPGRSNASAWPRSRRARLTADAQKNDRAGIGVPPRRGSRGKMQLKHIATATTEGYAARPGGAQAELLAEVNKHEADRNLELVLAEFRNYRKATCPPAPAPET